MQGACAAKAHQRKMAWVIALLHRNHPQRAEHIFVHDIDDAARRRHQVNAQCIGDGLHRLFRAFTIKLETATQQIFRKIAQHNIGVCHGWRFAALAIGDRSRDRSSGLRADAQGTGQFGDISDGPATRTDSFHIE